MTIWKFQLAIRDEVAVMMPAGAKPLSVQMQDGELCLWALVDPAARREPWTFRVVGTGHQIPDLHALAYIGSVQDRQFVWHVFGPAD